MINGAPPGYTSCDSVGRLPGCRFKFDDPDAQCSSGRSGTVGLPSHQPTYISSSDMQGLLSFEPPVDICNIYAYIIKVCSLHDSGEHRSAIIAFTSCMWNRCRNSKCPVLVLPSLTSYE